MYQWSIPGFLYSRETQVRETLWRNTHLSVVKQKDHQLPCRQQAWGLCGCCLKPSLCKRQPTTFTSSVCTSWHEIEIHTNFQTIKGQSYFWVRWGACQHTLHGMRVRMAGSLLCTLLQRHTVPAGHSALVSFTRLWKYKTEFIEFSYCCFLSVVAPSVTRKAGKQLQH